MCGRFVSASKPSQIAEFFGAAFAGETLGENYNVAPTADIYGVIADPAAAPDPAPSPETPSPAPATDRRLEVFHWGLVPVWAKDVKIGNRMTNARSETLAEKPAFKGVFRKHRVIIPMDGFYEWRAGDPDGPLNKQGKPVKQPMFIHRRDGQPLAVAGLWSAWRDREQPDSDWLHTATVVTTSANATMAPIHNRMPVMLPQSAWDEWLDPDNHDTDSLAHLLVPAPDDLLDVYPVSTEVNNARNHGAHLIEPVDPATAAGAGDPAGQEQLPL